MLWKRFFLKKKFQDSISYWEERYASGGTSGKGSYGELAEFKAQVLNEFVLKNQVKNIIEFGCGDGNQLKLAAYPSYVGFDVSITAINNCRNLFIDDPTKRFELIRDYKDEKAELTLSLDVIYHLVEDGVYEQYMARLFSSSEKFVIIYSNDVDSGQCRAKPHVKFRKFSDWIQSNAPGWELKEKISNPHVHESPADFFIYMKKSMHVDSL